MKLLLFTTPLAIVLQYFGSEKEIFSFDRNPKTFVLATLIVMGVLRLIALLFEHADWFLKMIPWKISQTSNQAIEKPPVERSGMAVLYYGLT
jgi:hypothetical protein